MAQVRLQVISDDGDTLCRSECTISFFWAIFFRRLIFWLFLFLALAGSRLVLIIIVWTIFTIWSILLVGRVFLVWIFASLGLFRSFLSTCDSLKSQLE